MSNNVQRRSSWFTRKITDKNARSMALENESKYSASNSYQKYDKFIEKLGLKNGEFVSKSLSNELSHKLQRTECECEKYD